MGFGLTTTMEGTGLVELERKINCWSATGVHLFRAATMDDTGLLVMFLLGAAMGAGSLVLH